MNPDAAPLLPFPISNTLLDSPEALRQRFLDDGYLFFRQLIAAEKIADLRQDFTAILADAGVIAGGAETSQAKATAEPFREGEEAYFAVHDRIMKLERFHALAHDEDLLRIMKIILGESAFPHPLSIARLIFPEHTPATTPPHQDFPNNQGSERLTAAWIPLGDCPIAMGPLKVLSGSHKYGVLPVQYHLGPGNRAAKLPPAINALQWHSSAFGAGDVLIFSALTVHAALDNLDSKRMRLSVDFRYQPEGEPLTPICLKPHFERLSWEEIYQDWTSDSLKYYWLGKRYHELPWDPSLHQLSEEDAREGLRMALEYAAKRGEIEIKLNRS